MTDPNPYPPPADWDDQPSVRALAGSDGLSVFAQMRAEVEQIATPPLTLIHPRPGMEAWTLTFLPQIDYQTQYRKWLAWATDRTGKKEVDTSRLNRRIIAETCVGIAHQGVTTTDPAGGPVTFTSEGLMAEFGVGSAIEAVKAFIVIDGGINELASKIIDAAGYGVEAVEADLPKSQ